MNSERRQTSRGDSGRALAQAAQAYVQAHSADKFSLQAVADALFVNGSYLLRTFKRSTGMTPLSYHHRVRCQKAKELLAQTDQTISEIGEAVGFVSSSHFSHIFPRAAGCSPSEYRIRNKPANQEGTSLRLYTGATAE